MRILVRFLLLVLCLFIASTSAAQTQQPRSPAYIIPQPSKIVIVFMENKSYDLVIGSCCAPFLNSLAKAGASLNFYAFHHPSQPNYYEFFAGTISLQMSDGTTIQILGDTCLQQLDPPNGLSVSPTLGDAFGNQFSGYAEGFNTSSPTACPPDQASTGWYARRHCPWTGFQSLQSRAFSFQSFPAPDKYSQLTTISMVTPDVLDDMHTASSSPPSNPPNCKCLDGSTNQEVLQGDVWLQQTLGSYVQWAQKNNGLLIVTFDEGDAPNEPDSNGQRLAPPKNHVATLLVGPMVVPGSTGGTTTYNHYDLQKTILTMYGKQPVGNAANPQLAKVITGVWTPFP
jgi:hypothetical protein